MNLTEMKWGGWKGKRKGFKVEILMSGVSEHLHKYFYKLIKDDEYVYMAESEREYFDTKEECKDAVILKIDELSKLQNYK